MSAARVFRSAVDKSLNSDVGKCGLRLSRTNTVVALKHDAVAPN